MRLLEPWEESELHLSLHQGLPRSIWFTPLLQTTCHRTIFVSSQKHPSFFTRMISIGKNDRSHLLQNIFPEPSLSSRHGSSRPLTIPQSANLYFSPLTIWLAHSYFRMALTPSD